MSGDGSGPARRTQVTGRPPARPRPRRRMPVLLQMTAVECGAACLAMVLSAFGRASSVRECRDVCGGGRDGVTAGEIARAARSFGLEAHGYARADVDFAELSLPAVLHWRDNHFVVLERWSPRGAVVVDPARGRRRLSHEEFEESVGGVVLTFEPGQAFAPRARRRGELWPRLRPLVKAPGIRRLVLQVAGASLLLQALGLSIPAALKVVLDTVLDLRGTDALRLLAMGAVVLVAAQLCTSYLRSALLVRLQGRVDWHALMLFFGHLLRLPALYFHHRTTGDVLMRAGSIAMLRELLANQTIAAISDVLLAAGYLAVLLWVSPPMGLLTGGFAAIAIVLLLSVTARVQESMAAELTAQAETHGHVVETLNGIATVKAMASERRVMGHLDALVLDWMRAAVRRSHLAGAVDAASSTLRVAAPLAVLLVGVAQVRAGAMTIGTMVAATWLAMAILAPVYALTSSGQRLQLAAAQLRRIADVLESEPEDERRAAAAPRLRGEVEVRSLEFSYHPRGEAVLADVSLHVPAGTRVALVGPTGAGKSTLGMALIGLLPPRRGQVLLDGHPLEELNLRAVREQLAVVLQDPWVFRGTIRENLTLGDSGFSTAEIQTAARVADLLDDIRRLPMGPDTQVGERGSGLSGGQQQRLAIARAVLRQPAVLLLDEATSHLDAVTESRIAANLRQLRCTQIVIAHRLSTVRDADRIVVLDAGRVVETGTHEELLDAGGHYAELVRHQVGRQDRRVGEDRSVG